MNRCVLDASALVRVFFHTGDAPPEALRFGASHGLTVYDSLYAVLAKREDATLVTADRKLFEKAGAAAIQALFLEPASA